jgi:hypothetical protein
MLNFGDVNLLGIINATENYMPSCYYTTQVRRLRDMGYLTRNFKLTAKGKAILSWKWDAANPSVYVIHNNIKNTIFVH